MADSRTYEIQLVETLRSIGRALGVAGLSSSGSSSSASSSISSNELIVAINGIISRLETNKSYLDILLERLEYDQDNDAFHVKTNFYADGFVSAGGVGSGGGGGGDITLADVWRSLTNDPLLTPEDIDDTTPINALHIPLGNGLEIDANGNIYVTSLGSVTSVAGVSPVNGDIPAASLVSALGLSSALKWRGVTTTDIVADPTSNPIVIVGDPYPYTATAGDVVVLTGTSQEYMWNGTQWNAIGDESSYALKTVSITGTGYLTGGGTLEQSRTIDIADSIKSLIDNAVPNTRTVNGYALSANISLGKSDIGLGNVDNIAAADYFTVMAMDGNDLSLTIGGTNKKLTVGYATIAVKTRFTPTESGATQIEPLLDWFVPETYTEGGVSKSRLRLNPKYAGMYADGFVSSGGIGTGGGGGGVDLQRMWASLQNNDEATTYDNYKIAIAHLPAPGAGLSITQSGSGSSIATSIGIDSNYKLPTTSEWNSKADASALANYVLSSSIGFGTAGTDYVPITLKGTTTNVLTAHQSLSGYATQTWVGNNYLPLSGGTVGGALTVRGGRTWIGANAGDGGQYENYHAIHWGFHSIDHMDFYETEFNFYANGGGTPILKVNSNTVWHAGNDGSGSGLDADLLDGQHGSYYAAASSLSDYLPLSGGTMTNTNVVTNLNADLLDGQHGSYYNNLITFYDSGATSANSVNYPLSLLNSGTPSAAWWYVTTMFYSTVGSTAASQIATSYSNSEPQMYIRQKYNSTWSAWRGVYHAGNSNLPTVSWSASSLTLAGAISGATNIDSLLYFDTTNSRVGIGITSPSQKLEIGGNIRVYNPISGQIIARFVNYQSSPYGLMMKSYNTGAFHLQSQREADETEVFPLLLNPNGGNVGIGNTSPSYKLDVSGVINASTGVRSPGYGVFAASASSSDARLKDGIVSISPERAWSVLMQLKPREWTWNSNYYQDGKRGAGLVAQEVEPVLPFSVLKEDKYLHLSYDVMHGFEIAGLQDLMRRVAALEKENAELKARLNN